MPIKVFDQFNTELESQWDTTLAHTYNQQYTWCQSWWEHFGDKRQLFILVVSLEGKVALIAPLYQEFDVVYPIGSYPDSFDEYAFLGGGVRALEELVNFLQSKKLSLYLKYLNTNNQTNQELVALLYQKNVRYKSKIIDNKPYAILADSGIEGSLKKRLSKIKREYREGFEFVYDVGDKDGEFEQFIAMHKQRWGGGMFEQDERHIAFVRNAIKNKQALLSALYYNNQPVAYGFGYLHNNHYTYSTIAYDSASEALSAGKFLLMYLMSYFKTYGVEVFDFGRGAEGYKYDYANNDTLLFHLEIGSRFRVRKLIQKMGFLP